MVNDVNESLDTDLDGEQTQAGLLMQRFAAYS